MRPGQVGYGPAQVHHTGPVHHPPGPVHHAGPVHGPVYHY